MEAALERLERRVRADLDVRRRLRREGPRLAATAVIVLGAGVALWMARGRRRHGSEPATAAEWFGAMPAEWQAQLRLLVEQAGGLPPTSGRSTGRHRGRPLWQTAALTSARVVIPRVLASRAQRRRSWPAGPQASAGVDGTGRPEA